MSSPLQREGFDQLDQAILRALQHDGRISVADLARLIHLCPPAVHQRIKRLERAGLITGYVALVDHGRVGLGVLAFIRLSIQPHTRERLAAFEAAVLAQPAVLECYQTTGGFDLLLKVVAADSKALDAFIQTHLMAVDGIDRIETTIVLHDLKSTTAVPLD